ncbi:hypothetical protein IKU74_05170 [bacterium]|nr:hypothetical protein [bacterium]
MVSNIYQQQTHIPMQAMNSQGVPIEVDVEKIKQSAGNTYVANRINASSSNEQQDMLLKAGVGTALWYGIAQGMDVFNRNCAKEYDKTTMGKVGAWGDRVAKKWNGTSVGKFFNKIFNKGQNGWDKLVSKSDIAYAIKNHSTSPEWAFAKTPANGLHGYLAMDMKQVFDEYLEPISDNSNKASWITGKKVNTQKLERYGMKQGDIDAFTQTLKGKKYAEKALMLQKKELELLGVDKNIIAKLEAQKGIKGLEKLAYNVKVKKLGFKSVAEYKKITSNILDHADDVMKALENATKSGDIKVGICRRNGWYGKFNNHVIGREVSLLEYLNKYKATLGKGNSTTLGKTLSKGFGWLMEGCTNRWGGGKIAVAMQAFIFADMIVHTIKAPSGEKGKTLAERFVNDFTYFMALPFGIMAMHKVGGLKYAGMTTDQVKAYRSALKQFNEDVKAGRLADKATYKVRKKALKDMLKANVKNPITKLLKKVGGAINIGNETRLARRSASKWNLNLLRKSGNFFKNLAGVPLRLAIPMMMISPFLAKLTTQGVHKLVGRPTKSVLDEDTEETKNEPKAPNAGEQKVLEEAIKSAEAAKIATQKVQQPTHIPQSPTNLLNQYVNRPQQSATLPNKPTVKDASDKLTTTQSATLPQQQVKRYIPSPECGIPQEVVKPKYIPSPQSQVPPEVAPDLSTVEQALNRANKMEMEAMRLLGR